MTPAVTELHAPDARPGAWIWFLHGFLGQGENWRSFARRLSRRRPEWGCLLVDLRLHGASQDAAPPHTLEAVAADLAELARARGEQPPVLVGHSFGGRAALAFAAKQPPALRQLWVLDASPATRERRDETGVGRVLAALRDLPPAFADRRAFTSALASRGVSTAIAQWLAKNLERDGERLRLALQLDALQSLLDDHDRQSYWSFVERPQPGLDLRFVLAGQSSVVPEADQERLDALAARGVLHVERLEGASHWLHADDPEGLLSLIEPALPSV